MSDENNESSKPSPIGNKPIKKTSAVPLRKETVRVTLKSPGAKPGMPAPPSLPTEQLKPAKTPTVRLGEVGAQAPKPSPANNAGGAPPIPAPTIPLGKSAAPAPSGPMSMTPGTDTVEEKVNLPDVTSAVPLKQETMRVTLKADKGAPSAPAPAPTIPLGNSSTAPKPALAAPTIPLGSAATAPLATTPLERSGSSQPLPKATVELQQTQQLTQGLGAAPTSQAATIQTVSDEDVQTKRGSGAMLPLSIISFVLSLVVLYFCFSHAQIWTKEHAGDDIMQVFTAPAED